MWQTQLKEYIEQIDEPTENLMHTLLKANQMHTFDKIYQIHKVIFELKRQFAIDPTQRRKHD